MSGDPIQGRIEASQRGCTDPRVQGSKAGKSTQGEMEVGWEWGLSTTQVRTVTGVEIAMGSRQRTDSCLFLPMGERERQTQASTLIMQSTLGSPCGVWAAGGPMGTVEPKDCGGNV